jgi:adenine C2-methylase RlmN of 23S rRNA A2503 and tRNA A37
MAAILTDIYLYKQTSNNMPLSKDTAFDTYVSIFIEHNTTKEIFQDSYNYYYAEANAMQHIYDDVTDNLKDKLTEEQLQVLEEEEEEERLEEEEKKNAETPE